VADLFRLRVALSGGAVAGPGLMTFYSDAAAPSLSAAVSTFLGDLASNLPTSLSWLVPGTGDLIDEATGAITGTWTAAGGSSASGISTGGYVLGTGATVQWNLGTPVNGRHVVGRTFIVPIQKGAFDATGHVDPAFVSLLQTKATNLITAMSNHLVIWTRPKPARAGAHGTLPAVVGSSHPIVSAKVGSTPTALRSRRV